jgi:hypothetical protein
MKMQIEIGINFRLILTIFFFVFGYYGWGTTKGLSFLDDKTNLTVIISIIFSSVFLYCSRHKFELYYPNPLIIKLYYFMIVVPVFLFGLLLNRSYIGRSLTTDELAYAWISQSQAYVIMLKISNIFPDILSRVNSSQFLQMISILILIAIALFLFLLSKLRNDSVFLVLLLFSTLILREIVKFLGGNPGQNSPLSSTWYFLYSSVFGSHNFIFRFASILLFACLLAYISSWHSEVAFPKKVILLLAGSLIFTVPFISNMSAIVEIANWSFLAALLVFVYLIRNDFVISPSLLLFLALAFYVRVNIIALFCAVFVTSLVNSKKPERKTRVGYVHSLAVLFPGFIYIMLSRFKSRVSGDINFLQEISINANNLLQTIFDSNSVIYLISATLFTVLLLRKKSSAVFIITYHILNVILFICLNSVELSSISKYQMEFLFPCALGLPLYFALQTSFASRKIFILFAVVLLLANLFSAISRDDLIKSYKQYYRTDGAAGSAYNVLTYSPFAYSEAYTYLKNINQQVCFNAGPTYSVFPEIMSGQALNILVRNREVKARVLEIQSQTQESWLTISDSTLRAADVNCVILGAIDYQAQVKQSLLRGGWKLYKTFDDKLFGSQTFILVRSPSL